MSATTVAATTAAGPSGRRLLPTAPARDLDTHRARHGAIPWRGGPGQLITTLESAGLTGRGGAGFPTWRKVASAAGSARGGSLRRPGVVIANGAEGEPASHKDAVLLAHAPHLALDGAQLAAEAVGAARVVVYVKDGPALASVRAALAEREHADLDRYPTQIVRAPKGFISGEESAAVSAVEGGPALPRTKRRLITERGVDGRPTLVQNVETLAHVALIARHGATWFRMAGTEDEPGTFLATLGGAVTTPGVVEAGYGIPLAELLAMGGGPSEPLRAVLVGGYHGAWVPAPKLAHVTMSRAGLGPLGASPGAGILWALPQRGCPLAATASIVGYLAGQSARQCGPCQFGLPALSEQFTRLADPASALRLQRLPGQLQALSGVVTGRGACRHPDGTVRLVRSALTTFADDVAAHLRGGCLGGTR
jgi:NADH:ubiquinone oxidoreductase subunit F (NADH-binding)